jgi:8-oxo-dGTP diphosphatase
MIRRYEEPPEANRRYTLRPGAYAIIIHPRGLLLTLQSSPARELQLPGGGIDAGEGPLQALYREVVEETGWSIAAPRRLGAFRRFTYMPEYQMWAEKLCHVYLARAVRRQRQPIEPDHEAVVLPAVEAARLLVNQGDRAFVRKFAL